MRYDFDAPVRRRGTNCVKWDVCAEGVLPLWVADMDFRAAPAIVDALCRRAEEGVYGYALPPAAWHESLAKWLAERHGWDILPEWAVDSTGVLPALGAVLRACCSPGDKVVLQAPAYNGFFSVIASQGCEIGWSPLRRVPARGGAKGGELARRLEAEAHVKLSPGSIYAEPNGGAFLRVNLASPRAMLMEALERVASWLP